MSLLLITEAGLRLDTWHPSSIHFYPRSWGNLDHQKVWKGARGLVVKVSGPICGGAAGAPGYLTSALRGRSPVPHPTPTPEQALADPALSAGSLGEPGMYQVLWESRQAPGRPGLAFLLLNKCPVAGQHSWGSWVCREPPAWGVGTGLAPAAELPGCLLLG